MNRYLLSIALLTFAGCSKSEPSSRPASFTGTALNVDYRVMVGHELSKDERHRIQRIIAYTFDEVDQTFNQDNPRSELSRLNKMPGGVIANLSPQLEYLLDQTKKIVMVSQGKFDPTVEPAKQLWKAKTNQNQKPSEEEISDLKVIVGWDNIHFHNGIFYKDHDLTAMDLSGITKGHAVDLILDRIVQADFNNVYVEWGGVIRTNGKHIENRPWVVAINQKGDVKSSKTPANLEMKDNAVATSDIYNKAANTKTAICIDPKTCEPAESNPQGIGCATFQANTCTFAVGLCSTALTFNSLPEAEKWASDVRKDYPEVSYWIVLRNSPK